MSESLQSEPLCGSSTPVTLGLASGDGADLGSVRSICYSPMLESPTLEKPILENPTLGFPTLGKPMLENRTQLNKDISSIYPKKKEIKNTDTSNPYQSSIHPSIPETGAYHSAAQADQVSPGIADDLLPVEPVASPVRRQTETLTEQQKFLSEPSALPGMRRRLSFDGLMKKIKDQIDYWVLIENDSKDEIDNIVSIMVEVMSTKCEYFTISGKKYPADLVHQRFSQITYQTIEYVLECMHKCGSDIRNIKQYLIATLFNAPATYDSYYGAAVRRDFEFLRG